MTVPSPVTALARVPRVPLFVQLVIVHPVVVQLVPFCALSQSVAPATHPGVNVGDPHTTALIAKATLFVILESPGFDIVPVKVTELPLAALVGMTGIRTVSVPSDAAMAVVLVQVTPVPT